MDPSHSTEQRPATGVGAGFADLDAIISHVPELVRSRDVRHRVFGGGSISRINGAIAIAATHALSSMWFFWFCVALDLIELPSVLRNLTPIVVVTYISQTVIQLLALPLLGAGQRIIAEAQDARAEADHKTLTALHTINVTQLAILHRLEKLEKSR
ncbi:MAG: hypothetical protein M3Z97_01670 [Candidatus Dormibacteraeota bacterium]|nr:hypothetical protein [Candidatus Dormibacteraeota bacterium]